MLPRPPTSTRFPYTTLFRSRGYALHHLHRFAHLAGEGARVITAEEEGERHRAAVVDGEVLRSEEHTSELQSHSDLVCRLLLEKKKNDKIAQHYIMAPPVMNS